VLILGLDVATRTGWAVVRRAGRRETLVAFGAINATAREIDALAGAQIDAAADAGEPLLAALEDSFLGRNVATLRTLAALRGRWEQALEMRGARVELVRPDGWQRAILTGLMGPRAQRAERKRAAQAFALATFGAKATQDQADAIGIATYGARVLALA
jgi:Holliday junction resolvasome RuvABC endonuclease subunit